MSLTSILSAGLRKREPSPQLYLDLWEIKTFNLHRGVIHYRHDSDGKTIHGISSIVRETVASEFQIRWWRGFGFGAIIEIPNLPHDIGSIETLIDTRAKLSGVWQWVILVANQAEVAVGIHTWTEGYLSPVFRRIIYHYRTLGYEAAGFKKEKDKLMKFLTYVADAKGMSPPEFE